MMGYRKGSNMTDEKESIQEVIGSYRKRQQWGMFIFGGLAIVLLISGLLLLALWVTGMEQPAIPFLGRRTPTSTATVSPTSAPTLTLSPTSTPQPSATPTATQSPTPAGPFEYVVEEGDNLTSIAEKFNVDVFALMAFNDYKTDLYVGDVILIPPPDAPLPTATPLPEVLSPGAQIQYRVEPGDMLEAIAARFNSTVEAILELNEELDDPNKIYPGQILIIPVNLVTPTPTKVPTFTPTP
jgi:LysM repeat protein